MLRRLHVCLILVLVIFSLSGCQAQKKTDASFNEFKNKIVGFSYLVNNPDADEPKEVLNISDKQLTLSLLELAEPLAKTEAPPSDWTGSREYLVFKYEQDGEIRNSKLYNYLHNDKEPGYLELEDGWHKVPLAFTKHLLTLSQYPEASSDINPTDAALLKQYNWTIAYKIKTYNGHLPDKFIHESGEYPVSLYYAYNNELNKDIGLDLTPYLGKNVTVNLYKINEPLPDFMAPRQDANRAVIVKDGEKIIGAWLDAGRHDAFACSLKGRRMEEITGKQWEEWVIQYIDFNNPQEKLISQMTPEKVIETYYEAIDHKDPRTAHATETRQRLVSYLFRNMDNNRLYNYSFSVNDADEINNINRAKIIKIQPYTGSNQDQPDIKKYMVEVDLNVKRLITYDSGRQIRFITLKKESPYTGWRIDAITTAP